MKYNNYPVYKVVQCYLKFKLTRNLLKTSQATPEAIDAVSIAPGGN